MTDIAKADVKATLARLAEKGQVIPLTDPARISSVLDGSIEECARLATENADLRQRVKAARQVLFPLLRDKGLLGELARTIEAELAPRPEPTPAA